MTEHDTPREIKTSANEDYVRYPSDHALRIVTVPRNANPETGEPERLESGWIITGETHDGEKYVVLKVTDEGFAEKRLDKKALDALQNDLYLKRTAERESAGLPDEHLRRGIGGAASREMQPTEARPIPQTVDERIAAGWAIPYSELNAAKAIEHPAARQSADMITSDQVPRSEERTDQESAEILPQHETHKEFWTKHAALVESIDEAIKRAGHFDPHMQAGQLARDIESIRQIRGLNPDMRVYLQQVIDMCDEVMSGGRNQRSPYYHDARPGLQKIRTMIRAIK